MSLAVDAAEKYLADEREDRARALLRDRIIRAKSADLDPAERRDRSLARVQRVVNRLRRFTEADKDGVLLDLDRVEVGMHLSEVCRALCEAPTKVKDEGALVDLSVALFEKYRTHFTAAL